jgi:hypothetical protein
MQTINELWTNLDAGKIITDGATICKYENGELICEPDTGIIPFNRDNVEKWQVLEPVSGPTYCRWYREDEETGMIELDNTRFHLTSQEPDAEWKRIKEAIPREDLIGS